MTKTFTIILLLLAPSVIYASNDALIIFYLAGLLMLIPILLNIVFSIVVLVRQKIKKPGRIFFIINTTLFIPFSLGALFNLDGYITNISSSSSDALEYYFGFYGILLLTYILSESLT